MKKPAKANNNLERLAFDEDTQKYLESKSEKYKVKAMTEGHEDLMDAIDECEYVICSGPAGSGKTHIALGKGMEMLRAGKYKKLLLIRPLQECGRSIGFLPGSKDDKISPHMKAFTDLFSKFCSKEYLEKAVREERICIDACEFMRGCTFDDTYIVIDEAQNCTYEQLKMLLTRVGKNSKMVVVGDATQADLPHWMRYKEDEHDKIGKVPMAVMMDRLEERHKDIEIIELDERDIVRNGLIGKILKWMG
jgi:phosphate starvation-inducible PhoH-like protein